MKPLLPSEFNTPGHHCHNTEHRTPNQLQAKYRQWRYLCAQAAA